MTSRTTPTLAPLDYLFSLELHGIKLGLSNIARLLRLDEDPHLKYPTVHIGGTNGKGSVVAMMDAMLRSAGYSTGRFTSPHLVTVRERFVVNGEMISQEELEGSIVHFRDLCSTWDSSPTFFEMNTAIAFNHFARNKVDVALIEVGMGGRLDSTNVIYPEATAITNIALEHTRYLGSTLEKIAFEKAGIIKEGVPTVIGEERPGPQRVLLDRAEEANAPLRLIGKDFEFRVEGKTFQQMFCYDSNDFSLGPIPLALPGRYQAANAAVAVATARHLSKRFSKLDADAITRGLCEARWPCRLERVMEDPRVIVDVAHNEAGAEELFAALESPCVVVLAVSSDKNADAMLRRIKPLADPLILTQFSGRRALPVDELCAKAHPGPYLRADTLKEAIDTGMSLASKERPLLIAGSLYTAGEAREILTANFGADPIRF